MRHLLTVTGVIRKAAAMAVVLSPRSAAKMICARCTNRCSVDEARTQDSNVLWSTSVR